MTKAADTLEAFAACVTRVLERREKGRAAWLALRGELEQEAIGLLGLPADASLIDIGVAWSELARLMRLAGAGDEEIVAGSYVYGAAVTQALIRDRKLEAEARASAPPPREGVKLWDRRQPLVVDGVPVEQEHPVVEALRKEDAARARVSKKRRPEPDWWLR